MTNYCLEKITLRGRTPASNLKVHVFYTGNRRPGFITLKQANLPAPGYWHAFHGAWADANYLGAFKSKTLAVRAVLDFDSNLNNSK